MLAEPTASPCVESEADQRGAFSRGHGFESRRLHHTNQACRGTSAGSFHKADLLAGEILITYTYEK